MSGRESLRPRRPFGLLDGLILVVPVAIGCAVARPYLRHSHVISPQQFRSRWRETIDHNERIASRFIAVAMPGLLVVCLRRPRPGLRRLSRQPGAVACAAASAALVAAGLLAGAMAIVQDLPAGRAGRLPPGIMIMPSPPPPRAIGAYTRPVIRPTLSFRLSTISPFKRPESTWMIFEAWIAPAVMAAWAALIFSRRWRAEPSWIDRAGRGCGFYWIALAVYRWVMIVVVGV
ncbi:MAG TPA: hypothetical protein VFF52_23765 [Isosphaeraceae bacterium]|nr:hypothetical protein [Isosphaeraceae bacterium]